MTKHHQDKQQQTRSQNTRHPHHNTVQADVHAAQVKMFRDNESCLNLLKSYHPKKSSPKY